MAGTPETPKESKVEIAKRKSKHLRGTIAETLASGATHFGADDVQLLKFHGTYQQDDRDVRQARRKQGLEEAYSFMVRCAIPAGVVTAEQYLALDDLADRHANGTLRVTTRQGIQFHGVVAGDLKATIAGIHGTLLTTLSACGDVGRNVMCCPAPLADEAHVTLRTVAAQIAADLRPKSRAFHEIWLDGEKQISTQDEEPFYGDRYLPRKFKTGIALAGDNCIDVYSYDLGLIAIIDGGVLQGYNVVVGGGMGMTHNKPDTFARLAEPLGFIDPAHAVETARHVAAIFRDHGNRSDRRHSRLKYLLDERGIDWFRELFRAATAFDLQAWRPIPKPSTDDHLGRHPSGDGKWFYGIYIENGRIKDDEHAKMKSGLRALVKKYRPGIRLTGTQNLLLTDLDEADLDQVEDALRSYGVLPPTELSAARRYSMACPALPTCGLAMAESERVMPSVVDMFEEEFTRLGMRDEPLTLRMTGCPNGCARPYTADIAFVGRRPDVYHVYVGGGIPGDRVADLFAADVPKPDLVTTLRPLLTAWSKQHLPTESLGDFYQRLRGLGEPRQKITGKEEPTGTLIQLEIRT